MFARLILMLLLTAFAVPAGASADCHEAAPTHHAMPDMSDDKAALAHVCIGCIPPGDWAGAAVAVPRPGRGLPHAVAIVRLEVGLSAPPALPPPRVA